MQIIIDPNEIDRSLWSEFVQNHPNGNIFQTPEMYDLYFKSDCYEPILSAAISNHAIVGILLGVVQKERPGLIGSLTSRAVIWGGPLAYDSNVAFVLLAEYEKKAKKKAIYSQFRNIFPMDALQDVFRRSEYSFEEHLDILIDLNKGEEQLWKEIHKNRKKEIKNGLNKNLQVQRCSILDSDILPKIYSLLEKLYRKIGLPVPAQSFFKDAALVLEPCGFLKTFTVSIEHHLVGFRIVLTYKNNIYDWFAASSEEHLKYRPNDVLPWEVIKWGCQNGYDTFDFGGAGKPGQSYGVRDYKLKFGGTLVNFGRFQKTHKPISYFLVGNLFKFWKYIRQI